MADPLSIATGILTFIGACNALASTIRKLHHLRQAPRELEELENEMSALQSYAEGIIQLVEMHNGDGDEVIGRVSLRPHIEKAHRRIQEIQQFLEDTLKDTSSALKIRKSAWLRWQSELNRLRQSLRDVRLELGNCMGLFSAAGYRQHEIQLEKMAIEGRAMHDRDLRILKTLEQGLVQQRPSITAEIGAQLNNMSQTLQATIQEQSSSPAFPNFGRRRSEDLLHDHSEGSLPADMHRPRSQSSGSLMSDETHTGLCRGDLTLSQVVFSGGQRGGARQDHRTNATHSHASSILAEQEPTVSLQVSHRQNSKCRRPCSCQCHRTSKLKTPDFLRQVTGQLLVGYAGISSFTQPCNEHACAQRQKALVRVQYSFPLWSLIQRMLTVVSYSGGSRGPEKVLRMSRIRPGLDEVFIQVQSGNMSRLQQLFIQGDASPFDATDTGWTLLHYALTAGQLQTAKFLKDSGADIHAEPTSRKTPFDVSWNRILSGCLDSNSELLLREVFNDDDELDRRQFTPLHKIVLGMIGKKLIDELEISTAHIDTLDSSGFTPLAWASARGDHRSARLLLEHGASLSITNDVGEEPVHLAAQTGNIETIKILVQAGADVNREVRESHMTPMHFAAEYQDNSEQIFGLAKLGAHVDGKDYLGWTPLHWASWRGYLASLKALLACGAPVLARSLDGTVPIVLAVANNSHDCVRVLVEAGADPSPVRDSQWNLLHYAAIGGSIATLRSLSNADLSGVDVQGLRTSDTGQTVLDMLGARLEALSIDGHDMGECEAWKAAWDNATKPLVAIASADFDADCFSSPARVNTDSTYFDADDEPFEHRNG